MKMGIERVLKENFSRLGSVIAVDNDLLAETPVLTIDKVLSALSSVSVAINGMGGKVDVVSAEASGRVVLK